MRKYVKRYQRWQKNIPLTSTFVIICGAVATFYFIYRVLLIVSPAIVFEQSVFNPAANSSVVCGEDEGSHLQDPTPILSTAYQKRIHNQPALTSNEVVNSDLSETDSGTNQPVGYSHSVDNANAQYALLQDADGISFLRAATAKPVADNATPPAWQLDPVTVKPEVAYAYSFWYRSTVPVHVSIEYKANGKSSYSNATTLQPTSSWQQFAAHFDNTKAATDFTVNLNGGTNAGQIDTRGFDIHQITNASLQEGLVSVTFDDGWESVDSTALELLKKYHIRTTQYIISDVAAKAVKGYMDFSTIAALKKSGAEIGSHTQTHCDQTTLDTGELQRNAVGSKQMLEKQGLGPVKSFAYPLGQYNSKTQAIYEKYYPLIRSSDFGYNDRYFDESDIHSAGVLSTTSDETFRSWLDYAKTHKLWIVLVYHKVGETGQYNVGIVQLEQQLRMIKASGMKVLPLSEAAATVRK